MSREAQSRCNLFTWALQWLSPMHPRTPPHWVYSLVKIRVNEEKLIVVKYTQPAPNASCCVCRKAALWLIDFCGIVHVQGGESCVVVMWAMIVTLWLCSHQADWHHSRTVLHRTPQEEEGIRKCVRHNVRWLPPHALLNLTSLGI